LTSGCRRSIRRLCGGGGRQLRFESDKGELPRSGSASYPPSLLLGILVYGYATGAFSSRKLEWATYDSVAFRFIAANQYPDHDTIAAFRRRFLKEIFEREKHPYQAILPKK
jgi:transposase